MIHRSLALSSLVLACLAGRASPQGQVLTVDNGPNNYGAAWALDLESDGTIDTLALLPVPDPVSDDDAFGSALAPLGDLDGNGIPDVAVGAPGDDRAGEDRGAVWILFRDADGTLASRLALRPGRNLFSPPAGATRFGSELASLGDLDGDGAIELAVSASLPSPSPGSFWILSLDSDGTVTRELEIGAGVGGFGGALDPGDGFGGTLASLGDLDGDGVNDLAVGAAGDDDGASSAGAAWLLLLNADGTVKSEQKLSNTSGGFGGTLSGQDLFGAAIAVLGDLDGDAATDLAVGAPGTNGLGGEDAAGAVWVLLLNADGTVKSEQKIGEGSGGFGGSLDLQDRFGTSAVAAGDLQGDGVTDLAVGAPEGSNGPGAIWVLEMNADGTVQSELRHDSAIAAPGSGLGTMLAGLGDWDGDGRADLAVGTSQRDGEPTSPDFTDLPSAITAAASGDTILVRGGTHSLGSGVVVDGKTLTIQAVNPGNVTLSGPLTVSNLAANQSVRLGGLRLRLPDLFTDPSPRLRLEHNDGRVWIDTCEIADGRTFFAPGAALSVDDCAGVIVNHCRFEAAFIDWDDFDPSVPAPPGLELSGGSAVLAYDSVFAGADGQCHDPHPELFDGTQQLGGPGIAMSSGFLFLSGCSVLGGDSDDEGTCPCLGGTTGLVAAGRAIVLDSALAGGQGCPDGAASSGLVELLSGESLSMFVNNPTRSGEPTLFTFEGPPGAAVYVLFSLASGARYRPALQGTDLLGAQRSLDFLGRADADGRLHVERALGTIPDTQVLRLFAQSLCLLPFAPGSALHPLTPQLGTGAMIVRLGQSF